MGVKMKHAGRLLVITLLITYAFYTPCQASSSNKDLAKFEELQLKALGSGKVRVIIKLDVPRINELMSQSNKFLTVEPGRASVWRGVDADRTLADAISYSAEFVKFALGKAHFKVHHIYKSIPYMALEVSAEALSALEFLPEVLAIEEDVPLPLPDPVEPATPADLDKPMLNNTVNITGASNAWSMGYTGAGWYVAILDTGIRKTHEMFAGKTIVEACFASGSDGVGPAGDCPNGLISMTGSGAALHYPSSYSGYDHGTHVSGIAAGHSPTLSGMAKDANIIAVQVFSKFDASYCGGAPCVLSYSSDQIAGFDYVYSIRGSNSIAAVNMSLGGGAYSGACDSASQKAAIDNLRAVGIATAIATGNNGYCGYVSSPACISSSVAVGASSDSDVEANFNNWHPTMQKLFAPGVSIYSSTGASNTSYESWSGTSMATPHVAGAWALIKQAIPAGSVTNILAALRSTGVSINTLCSSPLGSVPRIKVDAAIQSLITTSTSSTTTSIIPTTSSTSSTTTSVQPTTSSTSSTTTTSVAPDNVQLLVREYYLDILDREPDQAGWDSWTNEIKRIMSIGIYVGEGFQTEARLFFNSQEYLNKNKNDTQFVTDLYQTFLQREPDADGLTSWVAQLGAGLTRNMLVTQFCYSAEFKNYMTSLFGADTTRPENNLVNDFYRGILNRLPDNGGFNSWLAQMRAAQCTGPAAVRDLSYQLSLSFVQSAEYATRNRDNTEYVEDLYNAILRRGADPAGYLAWVSNLGSMSRQQVLQAFTGSPEFQTRVDAVIAAGCIP